MQGEEEVKVEEEEVKVAEDDLGWEGFTDPNHSGQKFLTKKEAEFRSQIVSDVNYVISLGLLKGGKTYNGRILIEFSLSEIQDRDFAEGQDNSSCLFIDYKGKLIRGLEINGKKIGKETPNVWNSHRIYIPRSAQLKGKNTAVIDFESSYVTDCQGFQYYKDDADNEEYIYTELEPDYCHICYPCFDQPDLKAAQKMLIVAPSDWTVITNTSEISQTPVADDAQFKRALKRFVVSPDSPIVTAFNGAEIVAHEYERSQPISTYLYCIVAGAFDVMEPEKGKEHPTIPMKLYCRKSLTQYAKDMKDDWFRVTQCGIAFYEKMFNTPYPFGKFDQVFCPDYSMGAMENVGCVTYNDEYISRGEAFVRSKTEKIFNTICHEISHMWFGNLVTMKWWDDLWLNESFANMISFMCMDEAEGLEDVTLAWDIFVDQQLSGLTTDQKETSHPIATICKQTGDA